MGKLHYAATEYVTTVYSRLKNIADFVLTSRQMLAGIRQHAKDSSKWQKLADEYETYIAPYERIVSYTGFDISLYFTNQLEISFSPNTTIFSNTDTNEAIAKKLLALLNAPVFFEMLKAAADANTYHDELREFFTKFQKKFLMEDDEFEKKLKEFDTNMSSTFKLVTQLGKGMSSEKLFDEVKNEKGLLHDIAKLMLAIGTMTADYANSKKKHAEIANGAEITDEKQLAYTADKMLASLNQKKEEYEKTIKLIKNELDESQKNSFNSLIKEWPQIMAIKAHRTSITDNQATEELHSPRQRRAMTIDKKQFAEQQIITAQKDTVEQKILSFINSLSREQQLKVLKLIETGSNDSDCEQFKIKLEKFLQLYISVCQAVEKTEQARPNYEKSLNDVVQQHNQKLDKFKEEAKTLAIAAKMKVEEQPESIEQTQPQITVPNIKLKSLANSLNKGLSTLKGLSDVVRRKLSSAGSPKSPRNIPTLTLVRTDSNRTPTQSISSSENGHDNHATSPVSSELEAPASSFSVVSEDNTTAIIAKDQTTEAKDTDTKTATAKTEVAGFVGSYRVYKSTSDNSSFSISADRESNVSIESTGVSVAALIKKYSVTNSENASAITSTPANTPRFDNATFLAEEDVSKEKLVSSSPKPF